MQNVVGRLGDFSGAIAGAAVTRGAHSEVKRFGNAVLARPGAISIPIRGFLCPLGLRIALMQQIKSRLREMRGLDIGASEAR